MDIVSKIFDENNKNTEKFTIALYEKKFSKDKITPTYLVTIFGHNVYKQHVEYICSCISTLYDSYLKLHGLDRKKEREFFIICTEDKYIEPYIVKAYKEGNAIFFANEKTYNDALNLFNELKEKENKENDK